MIIERILKLNLIAVLGLVLIVQCSRSQKKFDSVEASDTEGAGNTQVPDLEPNGQVLGDDDFIPEVGSDDDVAGSVGADADELEELAAEVGLTVASLRAGAQRVGAWDGILDDIPATAKWKFIDPATGAANTNSTANTNASANANTNANSNSNANANNSNGQGSQSGTGANDNSQLTREANGNVVFRIKAGTGQGPWNDANTAIVVPQGRILLVVNNDSIPHQLHTNGAPCQHGTEIPPGGSYQCNAQQSYNSGPLYDHISRGAVHIRTE